MKIYILSIEQVFDGKSARKSVEPHLTKDSAQIRFNAFVDDEASYCRDWNVEVDTDVEFSAHMDDSNYVKAVITEEELMAEGGEGCSSVNCGNHISIKHGAHPKNDVIPHGDSLKVWFDHEDVHFDLDIKLFHMSFTNQSNGYKGVFRDTNVKVVAFFDEDLKIWHCEAYAFGELVKLGYGDEVNGYKLLDDY